MNLLGIDIGTTSVKTALFDDALKLKCGRTADYTLDAHGDVVEFDPLAYWEIVKRELEAIGQEHPIDALAVDTQCETLILTDENGTILSRRRWVDRPYNELGLVPADIHVTIEDGVATYTSDTLVLGVCLDLDGDDAALSDNFFDLFPRVPYTVKLGSKSGTVLYHL